MKRLGICFIALALMVGAFGQLAQAAYQEQDWRHNGTGRTANNLEKFLDGDYLVSRWYQGGGQRFSNFDYIYDATTGVTTLKWSGGTVPDSTSTWACFSTNQNSIKHKYIPRWTFEDTTIGHAGPGLSGEFAEVSPGTFRWALTNDAVDGYDVTLAEFSVAIVPDPLSFADLRYDEMAGLEWLPGYPTHLGLSMGDSLVFDVPGVPEGGAVVCRAEVYYDFDPSEVVYYSAQIHISPVPTLTERGMIIFCVLLFGWMAWMVVRRKRSVTVGI